MQRAIGGLHRSEDSIEKWAPLGTGEVMLHQDDQLFLQCSQDIDKK